MATAYETAFKYEISNEIIAGIDGFISRNYPYPLEGNAPNEIISIDREIWEIYHKLPLENDYDKMDFSCLKYSKLRLTLINKR